MVNNITYGQAGQDSLIAQFFGAKGIVNGTFLDVGSLDGIRYSNTYLLEKNGWSGICVEMHPSYYEMLKENRPNSICYSCGAADKDNVREEVSLNWRASFSTTILAYEEGYLDPRNEYTDYYGPRDQKEINGFLNGRHEVELRTLNTILEENREEFPKINFVTIDIDGSEDRALPHCDLNTCSPDLLSLEWTVIGREACSNYANHFGLYLAREIGSDQFFVRTPEDRNLFNSFDVIGEPYHNHHPATGGE